MDIAAYLVDWAETVKRLEKDSNFANSLGEAAWEGEKWVKYLDWFHASVGFYFACATAWEAIRGAAGVPPGIDARARDFMDHLITFRDYCQELSPETLFLSMSPESAARFASLFAAVDFGFYREAFYSTTREDDRKELARYTPGKDPDHAFESALLPYIQTFGRAVELAAEKKKGLLITMS